MVAKHTLYHGQVVWVLASSGKILAKVTKINPKNVKVTAMDGKHYNAHPSFLSETSASDLLGWVDPDSSGAPSSLASPTSLHMGQVVKFKHPGVSKYEGLWVVCGAHAGAYRVARLGGDKGRYIRGVEVSSVEVVSFELAGV